MLGRLAEFWDNLVSLTESRAEIYEDTKSIERLSGLWPACCSSDKKTLRGLKKFIFPKIPKVQKNMILDYIENSKFRVPTMGLVISEANFFLCVAKGVGERLKADGNGFRLHRSTIRNGDKTEIDEYAYLRYFLDAARHVSNGSRAFPHASQNHDIHDRRTHCRKVLDSAHFWKYGTPSEVFDEKVLREIQPHYVEGHPPVCLVVKDFLESFWGPSVLQNLNHTTSQIRTNKLSALTGAPNLGGSGNGSIQASSKSNSRQESYGSGFKLKPFTFKSQASINNIARQQLCSIKAPDYASEEAVICSLGTPQEVHYHRFNESYARHISDQDTKQDSGIVQPFHAQDEKFPEQISKKPDRRLAIRNTDSYNFRRQLPSKAISEVYSPQGSKDDVHGLPHILGECYGPFRISLLEEDYSTSMRWAHAADGSSVYSSCDGSTQHSLNSDLGEWDTQTLVSSEKDNVIDERVRFVEHKKEAEPSLHKMLGIDITQVDGRRVLTNARRRPIV